MSNERINLPENVYPESLLIINAIPFTRREVDIISCLLHARGTNKMASFLSIAPKTIRNHIHHVMEKIGCNSRDGIIDFAERSPNLLHLKRHYINLKTHADFEKGLLEISRLNKHNLPSCKIVYWSETDVNNPLRNLLYESLKKLKIPTTLEKREEVQSVTSLSKEKPEDTFRVYLIPKAAPDTYRMDEKQIGSLYALQAKGFNTSLFFLAESDLQDQSHQELKKYPIDICDAQKRYYLLCLELIKFILSTVDIKPIIMEFKESFHAHEERKPENSSHYKFHFYINFFNLFSTWQKILFLGGALLICVSLAFIVFLKEVGKKNDVSEAQNSNLTSQEEKFDEERANLRYIPALPHHFDKELTHYKELLNKLGQFDHFPQDDIEIFAIVGVAGSGKTTLALWYANEYEKAFYTKNNKEKKHTVIFKLNAENIEELNHSYSELAKRLGVNSEQSLDSIINEVNLKLEKYPGWLLIFDNVKNAVSYQLIKKYFPEKRIGHTGRIIITSQDLNLNLDAQHIINVSNGAPKEAAFRFLKNHISIDNPENAYKLVEYIDSLPLSLIVATLFIKKENETKGDQEKKFTVSDYYTLILQHKDIDIEKVQTRLLTAENADYRGSYNKTQASVVRLAVKGLSDDSYSLLTVCGFIVPDFIKKDLLTSYFSKLKKLPYDVAKEKVNTLINEIKRYGLFYNIDDETLTIHRTTQNEIQELYLGNASDKEKKEALIHILKVLNECSTSEENENTLRYVKLTQRQQHLARHLERFKKNLEHLKIPLSSLGREGIDLLSNIGIGYKDIGVGLEEIHISKKYLQGALDLALMHPELPYYIARSKYDLAIVKREMGELDNIKEDGAITLFKSAENLLKQNPPPKDKEILLAHILHNHAICYVTNNDFKTAVSYFKKALNYYKDRDVIFRTYSWLGHTLIKDEKYEEGASFFELANTILLAHPNYNPAKGDEYLNYLDIAGHNYRVGCGFLAYSKLSKTPQPLLEKAIHHLEMARKARERERNYRRLAPVLNQLGQAYSKAKDVRNAKLIFDQGYEVSTKALGPEHAVTQEIKKNLGALRSFNSENVNK